MRASLILSVIVGLVLASALAQEVVVLNGDNFDETIASKDLVLVEFFAPWCGHCKQLAPKFATAAEQLAAAGITNAILASVDCTVEAELGQRFQVQGYPTLIAFKKDTNNPIPYNGAREVDALVNFIKKKSADPVTSLTTTADLDAVAAKSNAIVLFGGSADDFIIFSGAADADEAFSYYTVSDESIISAAGAASPSIKLYRSFSETPAVFTTFPLDGNVFAEFIEANGFPLVSEINQDSYQRLSKRPFPLIILVLDTDSAEKDEQLELLTKIAGDFTSLSITYGPSSQLLNAVKQFGGTGDVIPSLIGFVVPAMGDSSKLPARFAWPEELSFTEENIRSWLQSVVDGNPKIHKKSAPVPEDNSGPVTELVASTFDEAVLTSGKYSLVEFYAPWCGHCKQLVPTYEKIGEHYAGNDKVLIAKIDATENWIDPAYNVQGFPTILLFKPDGSYEAYQGERTEEAFIAFVDAQSGSSSGDAPAAGHDEL